MKNKIILAAAILTVVSMTLAGCAQTANEKADATVGQMTFEEKVRLLHGPMTRLVPKSKRPEGIAVGAGYIEGVPRLGVPLLNETDASLGVSNLLNMRPDDVATALPSGLALASTWDPELIRAGGEMIGSEARAKGFNVMLVGGVNLVRDPRAGRNFEYLGEDPYLAGVLVGAQIKGVQSNNIIGTIKHLALNDQETGRNVYSVEMDEEDMRESDLLAFEIGIEQGNPGSVMCAYNRVNGVYTCENAFLLNKVLREDWGYSGYVMSDWGSVKSTEAILAGLDQQSGEQLDGKPHFSQNLVKAVEGGEIPASAVDQSAKRVLTSIYEHGLDQHPITEKSQIDYERNANVALESAKEGIVLLKNRGGILPLSRETQRIAAIGPYADLGVPSGGGSSQVTPVGGFEKLVRGVESGPAASFALRGWSGTTPLEGLRDVYSDSEVRFADGSDINEAKKLAEWADAVVFFADRYSAEAVDHDNLSLGEGQDELIAGLTKSSDSVIVVLQTGNPVLMPWQERTAAIVSAWYSGQKGGLAVAEVLVGKKNPSGHLPVTFPRSLQQLPNPKLPGSDMPPADKETRATYGLMAGTKPFEIHYPEGSDVGYRWFDKKDLEPLYPFGYGLSYTTFNYDNLKIVGGDELALTFTVTNTGKVAGADVPQVYVSRPGKAKRLVGWGKPYLEPGQSETVKIIADPRVLADWDAEGQRWIIPAGTVVVEVSHSSEQPALIEETKVDQKTISY